MKEIFSRFKSTIFSSVLIYGFFGTLWITFSDRLLLILADDPALFARLQTYKGWFYILITSVFLYALFYRHEKKSALIEREQWEEILTVPIPMVIMGADGVLKRVNQAFTQAYGYELSHIPDMDTWYRKAYPNENYRRMVREEWAREEQSDGDEGAASHIFTIADKWGGKRTVEFFVLRKRDSVIIICKDITMQKQREEDRLQENKMTALGELAGGIAHDFNNQLTGIQGFSELLRASVPPDSPEREYLDAIISSTRTAAELTSELLTYTRNRTGRDETVDMKDILGEIETLVKRTFPRQYHIEVDSRADRTRVRGHSARLQNMVLNLVLNARDAMPEGGQMVIHTYNETLDSTRINGLPLQKGDYLVTEVSDRGSGISPAYLGRIFEPLYTTKEKGHGTGMGLALVYSTLRSHKGSIAVESRLGEGTRFRIYLPLDRGFPGGSRSPGPG